MVFITLMFIQREYDGAALARATMTRSRGVCEDWREKLAASAGSGGAGQRYSSACNRPAFSGFGTSPDRSIMSAQPNREWDPDHPWAVDIGVPPVVLPPPPAWRLDPGPALGLER